MFCNYTIVLLLWMTACINPSGTFEQMLASIYSNTVPQIRSDSLTSLLEQRTRLSILDTRPEVEYEVAHLKGARCVGYEDFHLDKVKDLARDQIIIVYCSVGYRSERIGERLQEAGYTKVYNLYGGIFEWKNKNNLVYDRTETVTDSMHVYSPKWGKWFTNGIKVYKSERKTHKSLVRGM